MIACVIKHHYPKQQRGRSLESVEVKQGDNTYSLIEERPGWYFPLEYSVNQKELENGAKYQITSPDDLDYLILPARDFWILVGVAHDVFDYTNSIPCQPRQNISTDNPFELTELHSINHYDADWVKSSQNSDRFLT
ncbi:hypothetical protein [Nostoc sp.]|uniref:hypothetical protein n=1 Tax=Nostoc sp. TaxID=1180 RepID=UPI002FF5E0B0